ncbi:hypothetical protein EYZ11_012769 [Aspergillus tanneri]|uniref:Uncharacterized protein n=1 Tax=Aspergillus tanneri TaxID=1220188 RepID=A0A4V3UMM3_9EURO|nr:hypothetical protein EYZ11_012769 [Aspergillus tanneri]
MDPPQSRVYGWNQIYGQYRAYASPFYGPRKRPAIEPVANGY